MKIDLTPEEVLELYVFLSNRGGLDVSSKDYDGEYVRKADAVDNVVEVLKDAIVNRLTEQDAGESKASSFDMFKQWERDQNAKIDSLVDENIKSDLEFRKFIKTAKKMKKKK